MKPLFPEPFGVQGFIERADGNRSRFHNMYSNEVFGKLSPSLKIIHITYSHLNENMLKNDNSICPEEGRLVEGSTINFYLIPPPLS